MNKTSIFALSAMAILISCSEKGPLDYPSQRDLENMAAIGNSSSAGEQSSSSAEAASSSSSEGGSSSSAEEQSSSSAEAAASM